jgi:hypothetical protein
MIEAMLRNLRQPEYVHILLNPLPVYGLAIAWLGLIIALFLRNRSAQITTLILICVCSVAVWPVAEFGDRAKDPVISMENEIGQDWIKEHERRADQFMLFFYLLGALSLAAIVVPKKWPGSATPLALGSALLGVVVLGMGAYIAQAGGKIRHHEFRNEPPPKSAPAT